MKFTENILNHDESLLRSLNTRIGALKMVGKVANFKTRKMIADGIFMSKLLYLITLWGESAKYLIESVQKAQNKAARVVTKLDWSTPVAELLKQCGWLSVQQLIAYHSVVQVYKIMQNESPKFLYSMFSATYSYKTKYSQGGLIKHTRSFRLDITESSFRWRAAKAYGELPLETRKLKTCKEFKISAKKWVKENVPLV